MRNKSYACKARYLCMLFLETKIKLTPTWFEHAAFWSGVRRATIAPRSQLMGAEIKKWVWYSRITKLLMPGDFDAYLRSPPRWGFNVLSFTAEASVIGSEAERKRMLIGGRGVLDPSGRLCRGESVKHVVMDSDRVYNVRWQFNGELKIRRRRRQRERQKKQ